MIFTLIHERDPIPWRITYIEYRSPVKIFINFLRNTTHFHLFSLQNMLFFHSSPRDCPSKTRCNTLSMLKSQLSLCGTGLNHRRLQQSMLLSKTWKDLFSWIKMDSRKYSMHMLFFSDSGRCFYSMYRFFYRFREMFLRPKLSILYSMYPIGIIYIYLHTRFCTYLYNLKGKTFAEMLGSILTAEMRVKAISKGNHSICGNAGRKQFQGGSIPTAEKLV